MDNNEWFKQKVLPALVTLAIINAVYAYTDVRDLDRRVRKVESVSKDVKDVKKLMCLLALDTDKEDLKKEICAGKQ